VTYPSQAAAARALGVSKGVIHRQEMVAKDPNWYKKVYAQQAECRRRYALKIARKNLPAPTRPCPSVCEVRGCSRRAVCL